MNTLTSFVVFAAAVIWSGCTTPRITPREAFFRAHPEERSKYLQLYEDSPEELLQRARRDYNRQQVFIRTLQSEFRSYADLTNRLERIHTGELRKLTVSLEFFEQIRQGFDPKIDALFYYLTENESGWLVVRGANARRKHVFINAQ